MLGAFWDAVGGKLADRAAAVSLPALVFWLAGLAAWLSHHHGPDSLTAYTGWLDQQRVFVQAVVVVTVLLAVAASAVLVRQAATPLLRFLEGYWPAFADPLRRRLADRLAARAARDQQAWQDAYARVHPPAVPTVDELAAYTRLERRRRRRPTQAGYFLPTPIGNILRAAERRPLDKYGLDTVICWPRLWPALPDTVRADLLAARAALDTAATTTVWALLYCAFAPLALWAVPLGLAVAALTVTVVIPARAQVFGELIEAAFDTHRATLYTRLRWPLPTHPRDEHEYGRHLTAYLWRGSDDTTPTFTPPP